MRKLHRVHEHGITNASVLARAGLSPDMQLLSRAQRQVQLLLQDADRDHDLKQAELRQAMVIHSELEQLSLHETPSMLTPVNAQHVTQLPCPVCGITFDGVRSLHMHIQAKHPDLNVAARIHFNRAEHSLFGLPFCRFCRVRCTNKALQRIRLLRSSCPRSKPKNNEILRNLRQTTSYTPGRRPSFSMRCSLFLYMMCHSMPVPYVS